MFTIAAMRQSFRRDHEVVDVTRRDIFVQSEDNFTIAVREILPVGGADANKTPVVFLHGTRIPGLSEYDLDVPDGSFAGAFAALGHPCYVVDARGFGRSQRPAEMEKPPVDGAPALVRTIEITRDLRAVSDFVRSATGHEKASFFGWGAGGTCCLMFAALYPDRTSHIMLYDTIYGGGGEYNLGHGSKFEDPNKPGHFNHQDNGNYNFNTLDLLEVHWDKQIPIDDKAAWRDPRMVVAFSQALLDGDPTSMESNPPTYRSPNGMLEDLYHMACGRKLVHGCQVYSKVMIIRPEFDTLCQESDMDALVDDLVNAQEVVHYAPPNTTHYLLLDRPERGRDDLIVKMQDFLS